MQEDRGKNRNWIYLGYHVNVFELWKKHLFLTTEPNTMRGPTRTWTVLSKTENRHSSNVCIFCSSLPKQIAIVNERPHRRKCMLCQGLVVFETRFYDISCLKISSTIYFWFQQPKYWPAPIFHSMKKGWSSVKHEKLINKTLNLLLPDNPKTESLITKNDFVKRAPGIASTMSA